MPATISESIVDQIHSVILPPIETVYDGTPATASSLLRSIPYEVMSLPSIVVRGGEDEIQEGRANLAYIDRTLTVYLDIYVSSNDSHLENLDFIRLAVYEKMMAERTLQLSEVLDTLPAGDAEPELTTLEKPTVKQTMAFEIHYRHNITNSGTLS